MCACLWDLATVRPCAMAACRLSRMSWAWAAQVLKHVCRRLHMQACCNSHAALRMAFVCCAWAFHAAHTCLGSADPHEAVHHP